MREIGVEEARKQLGNLVDDAAIDGTVTHLTRRGRTYAAIVPIALAPKEIPVTLTYRIVITATDRAGLSQIQGVLEDALDAHLAESGATLIETWARYAGDYASDGPMSHCTVWWFRDQPLPEGLELGWRRRGPESGDHNEYHVIMSVPDRATASRALAWVRRQCGHVDGVHRPRDVDYASARAKEHDLKREFAKDNVELFRCRPTSRYVIMPDRPLSSTERLALWNRLMWAGATSADDIGGGFIAEMGDERAAKAAVQDGGEVLGCHVTLSRLTPAAAVAAEDH